MSVLRFALIVLLAYSSTSIANEQALVSIIIDDLGYKHRQGLRAVSLPGPVICAIMPHSPYANSLADRAHRQGKEIILHVPMEAEQQQSGLGPGALTLAMHKQEFISTLRENIDSVPQAIAINNHMGSLLTRHPLPMQWLMHELKQQGFAYIDSMTSKESVATTVAKDNQVPFLARDVFLDNQLSPAYITAQLQSLVKLAQKKGFAVAIGHPYTETLDALEYFIEHSHEHNIRIVSLKEMIEFRQRMSVGFQQTSQRKTYQISQN